MTQPSSTPDAKPAQQYLIELRDIKRFYQMGNQEVHALAGASLTVAPNEYVAIMGPSGSGKSTLMNILGCLDRPSAGRYLFNGQDVSALGRDALARLRREAFGFVFQSYNLIPGATALRNVEVPAIYAESGGGGVCDPAGIEADHGTAVPAPIAGGVHQ